MIVPIFTLVALTLLLLVPLSFAQRDFTSTDGKKLNAEIVSALDADVTLKRNKDEKDFTIPLARLSEEDQKFVGAWLEKRKRALRHIGWMEIM